MKDNNQHIHKWEPPNKDLGEIIRINGEDGLVCRQCGIIKSANDELIADIEVKIRYKCVSRTGKRRCICSECRLWHILENFDGHGTCLYKQRDFDITRFDMLCNETGVITK